ncbi:MAG: hypothetical protein HYZ92_03490 [Candidatus Omnitrophica bacterium]|nr:hypothetical protein [Candidatus Omnitrophota bacterium]
MIEDARDHSSTLAVALLIFGVAARLLPHPPNATPVAAIALFGGATLPRRLAWWLPLAVMVLSDLVIGLHDVILFTWGGFVLTSLLGLWLRRRSGLGRIAASAVAGSLLFFMLTNFGVWLLGDAGRMYPKTLDGLWQCYAAALPFYRNTLLGDLAWSAGLFGLYALAARRLPSSRPVPST